MRNSYLFWFLFSLTFVVAYTSYSDYLAKNSLDFAPEGVNCASILARTHSDFNNYQDYIYNVDGWCCNIPKQEADSPQSCVDFKCVDASSDKMKIVAPSESTQLIPFWRAGECNREKQGKYAVEYTLRTGRSTFATPGRIEGFECKKEDSICFNRYQEYQAKVLICNDGKWESLAHPDYKKEGFLGCSKSKVGTISCEQDCGGIISNLNRDLFEAKESQRVITDKKKLVGLPGFNFKQCEVGIKETNDWNPSVCVPGVPI